MAACTKIITVESASPPVHVTVRPFARFTEKFGPFCGLLRTAGWGSVRDALNEPISGPPAPVTVYVPGPRNAPEEFMVVLDSPGLPGIVTLPLGPLIVKLDPALRSEMPVTGRFWPGLRLL